MTSHASRFLEALTRIEPGDDADHAQDAHLLVSDALCADPKLKNLGVAPLLIGSYARDVSIRRVKDVDLFARLKNATASTWPGETYNHVVKVLEAAFPENVTRQHRSVMVTFPDYDLSVDVVIARRCVDHPDDHWQIPQRLDENSNARWIETNPHRMTELKSEANAQFVLNGRGVYVPTVKLVRQVRRTWVVEQPGGYYFEPHPTRTQTETCLTSQRVTLTISTPGHHLPPRTPAPDNASGAHARPSRQRHHTETEVKPVPRKSALTPEPR